MHFIRSIYSCYIQTKHILHTLYIQTIYLIFTCYLHVTHLFNTFYAYSRQVLGVKINIFKKSVGDGWHVFGRHRRGQQTLWNLGVGQPELKITTYTIC